MNEFVPGIHASASSPPPPSSSSPSPSSSSLSSLASSRQSGPAHRQASPTPASSHFSSSSSSTSSAPASSSAAAPTGAANASTRPAHSLPVAGASGGKARKNASSSDSFHGPSVQPSQPSSAHRRAHNHHGSASRQQQQQHASHAAASSSPPGSLNHLLNFSFTSTRDSAAALSLGIPPKTRFHSGHHHHGSSSGGGGGGAGSSHGSRSHHHSSLPAFTKERYLQSHCQFLVRDSANTVPFATDPDALVDWDTVEEVRVFSGNDTTPSCPICLSPPVAAKITKCGHVYCWTCVLQYLSLSDKKWRKCPICFESIYLNDLRSAVPTARHTYTSGEKIKLQLMKRSKNGAIPVPAASHVDPVDDVFRIDHVHAETAMYSCVLRVSADYVLLNVINREKTQIDVQLNEARESKDEAQIVFINQASHLLQEREALLQSLQALQGSAPVPYAAPAVAPLAAVPVSSAPAHYYDSAGTGEEAFSDGEGDSVESAQPSVEVPDPTKWLSLPSDELPAANQRVSNTQTHMPPTSQPAKSTADPDFHYFYQAVDGQHLYLHPINAKCLLAQFDGTLRDCPPLIEAKILELEDSIQSEDSRKRYRILSHLPLTCEFTFCEVDLNWLLAPAIREQFAEELARRHKKRTSKIRQEKSREKRLEMEARMLLEQHRREINISSLGEFPSPSSSLGYDISSLPALQPTAPISAAAQGTAQSFPPAPTGPKPTLYVPPSFAQAAKAGFMADHDQNPHVSWANSSRSPSAPAPAPTRASVDSSSTRPGQWAALLASKTAASGPIPVKRPPPGHSHASLPGLEDGETDEAPSYQQSFAQALWEAIDQVDREPHSGTGSSAGPESGEKSRKAKKGGKKTVLFTTSGGGRKY